MKKIRVIFLGSRPLGHFAYNLLTKMANVEIVGCVVKKPSLSAWWNDDPYELVGGNNCTHDEIQNIDFDLGVSINYWKIIEPEIIRKPSLGFINIHHSYMLSLRGRDMTTHAILQARKFNRWYHGTTLHYTDDGLDTGPIIATESCPITEFDTAWTLFNKTEALAMEMLHLWIPRITAGRPPFASPEKMQPLNLRSDGVIKKIDNIFCDPIRSYDIVRAYDFNGHYEPASTIISNQQIYLTTNNSLGGRAILEIDSDKKIYEYISK